MPQYIEVKGEVVEFPDNMSDEQIATAIDPAPTSTNIPTGQFNDPRGAAVPLAAEALGLPGLAAIAGGVAGLVPGGETGTEKANRYLEGTRQFFGAPNPASASVMEGIGNVAESATQGIRQIPAAFATANLEDPGSLAEELAFQDFSPQERAQTRSDIVSGGFGPYLGDVAEEFGAPPSVSAGLTALPTGIFTALTASGIGRGKPSGNVKDTVLREAGQEGYVVPTSDAGAGIVRGTVEGVAGKPRMQQQASFRNQEVTNRLAAKELDLPAGTEITFDALDAVRAEAGQAYHVLDNAGTITTGTAFRRDLSAAVRELKDAAADFPALAGKTGPVREAIDLATGLNKSTFNASSVATVTKILRDNASTAFRNGQATVGRAYRKMSNAIEDAAEAHLVKFGDPDAVAAFQAARQRIAKSYTVEKALDGDGFVSAPKLASMRKKREPLSGGLDLAARFAEQFPQAARVFKARPIETGRLSAMLGTVGTGGAALAGSPSTAALIAAAAFGGPLMRNLMLSKPMQSLLNRPSPASTGLLEAGTGLTAAGANQ